MQECGRRVVLSGVGSFLPNDPVPTDRIDDVLGPLDGAPQAVRVFAERFGRRFTKRSGVEHRHFAIDPKTGELTHTAASLAEEACRRALADAGRQPRDVDLLLLSTPIPDQLTPPTTVMLQEKLGVGECVEMEIHANCSGLFKCVQIASDALRLGRHQTALVVYPQISSAFLRSSYYNQAKMTKTQAALRYILTDGSGALVLEGVDTSNDEAVPRELVSTYVESAGFDRPPAMTSGAGIVDLVLCDNFQEIFRQGTHHVDQDLAAVSREAPNYLLEAVKRHIETTGLAREDVTRFVASFPSVQQYAANVALFEEYFPAIRLAETFPYQNTGYCGGAAVLVWLDELVRTGNVQPGEVVLVQAVESSKWMSGGFAIRW